MEITIPQQIESVKREIAMRRRVYPRWIELRKITAAKADHEIACMEAVLRTLASLAVTTPEPKQEGLFT